MEQQTVRRSCHKVPSGAKPNPAKFLYLGRHSFTFHLVMWRVRSDVERKGNFDCSMLSQQKHREPTGANLSTSSMRWSPALGKSATRPGTDPRWQRRVQREPLERGTYSCYKTAPGRRTWHCSRIKACSGSGQCVSGYRTRPNKAVEDQLWF